jgi:diguanylate cyclase (GGDEF)-like protein/PAS domain S-box-containing protein
LQGPDDQYRLLFDKNPHPMWIFDRQTLAFLAVNEAAAHHYGYSQSEFLTMTLKDIQPWGDIPSLLNYRLKAKSKYRASSAHYAGVWKHRRKDGTLIDVEITSSLVSFNGKDTMLVLVHDITRHRIAEEALRQSQQKYETLINLIDGIVWEADARTFQFTFVGQQAERLFGYPIEQWLTEPTFWADHVHPDDRGWAVAFCKEASQEKKDRTFEYRMVAADGHIVWLRDLISVVVENGQPVKLRGVMVNITDQKQAEERLHHLAHHDGLTDLPNRILFMDRLGQALSRVRWHMRLVAILFLDLDHFKRINDTLGHDVGDLLLKAVAERLSSCVRAGDTVARMGGDEFTIILADVAQAEDVPKVAQKIIDAIAKPFLLAGHELFVTTSMGISLFPDDGQDVQTLLKNADAAMYRAKEQGRNHYQHYSPVMNVRTLERLALESSLRHALERKELLLHYQPRVDLNTGQIICVEALLRWQYPDLGLIPPNQFIHLAEETGLIIPIGEWVLHTACKQNKLWQAMGLLPIRVAVNLSPRQFEEKNFVETIARVLKDTGLDPNYLELELTENLVMKNAESSIATLRQLNAMGIQISIDDFGTGYSSLSYLRRFPIHSLKIDQSFVRDITTDPDDSVIVTAMIILAHSLKLKVIAEGVETKEQLDFLRSLKCHEMQGYLFSKPLPENEMTRLLATGKSLSYS